MTRIWMEPVLAVDLGTTKIEAVIGRQDVDGPRVLAVASGPSAGIEKGLVVDVQAASQAVAVVVGGVSKSTGLSIGRVHVAAGLSSVTSFISSGKITVIAADKIVTSSDRQASISESVRKAKLPPDQEIVQAIPVDFSIDGDVLVRDPIGLATSSLEARVHIIGATTTAVANIRAVMRRAGLEVVELVLQPVASTWGVLRESERENALVADIGGGTTGMALIRDNSITAVSVLPVGGNHITRDLSLGLKLHPDRAEEIKTAFGQALGDQVDDMDFIDGGTEDEKRAVSRRYVCQIIEARLEEIFKFMKGEAEKLSLDGLAPAKVVLTGGSSRFAGIDELATRVLGVPVRTAAPIPVNGLSEDAVTADDTCAVGLLVHSVVAKEGDGWPASLPPTVAAQAAAKIKDWLSAIGGRSRS